MRKLLIAGHLVALSLITVLSPLTANAAPGGNAEWAKRCQSEYTALGYRNVGQCVAHYARGGGTVVPGPATLTLVFETAPCIHHPEHQCMWTVNGSGLDPGSEVIVGDAAVFYGGPVSVAGDGTVNSGGIYEIGSCVLPDFIHQTFIARGVAADGTPIASETVEADYSTILPVCT